MKRLIAILFFAVSLSVSAQSPLTVDAPTVVSTDETFRVVFTANGNLSNFNWEGSTDFDIVWGPQTGSMSSTSIVNGKRTSSHQETVTYLLMAKGEGKFNLPAATAKVDKQDCSSNGFSIEVVKGQTNVQQSGSTTNSTSGNSGQSDTPVSGDDIFLKLSVSKTNVVKGEPVSATLKIYTRTDIAAFEDIRFPTFNGFWSKETLAVQDLEFTRENVGGTIYNSALIRQYMLIPQQSGKLTIDPAEMVCQIRVRASQSGGMRSIFDDFFDSYQTIRKRISTQEITINVKDLPSGAPSSFAGGVGKFKIEAETSKDQLKSNEAASLYVTISGNGNISMLDAPKVNLPSDFEVYDIKSSDKISANGTSGSKTFEFPFIPRSHGDYTIDAIEYSYYDIDNGKYVTVKTEPMTLHIEKGEDTEGSGVLVQGINRQGVRNLAEDIRYISLGDGGLKKEGAFFAGSPLFFILLALFILLHFIVVRLIDRKEARQADIAGTKNRKANKMARTRLKVAEDYLKKDLQGAYYEELHKALLGYVSDKLSIPMADLSKERISETMDSFNVSESTVSRLMGLVDKCEFARYAPENKPGEMESEFNEALNVISQIESEMKKTGIRKAGAVKSTVAVLALLFISIFKSDAETSSVSTLWQEGNDAFSRGEWQNSLNCYKSIENENIQSAQLYYNIGNAYFKLNETGYSILYFEKALKLDPSFSDAENNLAIASQLTLDKIESVPEFFLITWTRNLRNVLSADGWAVLTLILAFAISILMVVFRKATSLTARKAGFIASCIIFVIAIFSLTFSLTGRAAVSRNDTAIVTAAVSSVKSSPAETGMSIFVLHEGTKVEILDNVGEWTKIELADGRQGWISSGTISLI